MTDNRQIEKWEARYRTEPLAPLAPPSAPLPDAVANVAPGHALDLACGSGRHTVWLARRGWTVDAVDGAAAALRHLERHADAAQCRDRVTPIVADLEGDSPPYALARDRYDLVVDAYFLHRPLFDTIRVAVRAGGLFVAVIHLPTSGDGGHRFVLRAGELEEMVRGWGWTVVHSVERDAGHTDDGHDLGVAEIIAQRPVAGTSASRPLP